MSDAQFNVVFNGVLDGFDADQVQRDFAQLFSLDTEKVARIFAAGHATLKSAVSEAVANQYIARLAAIGVKAIADAQVATEPTLSLQVDTDVATAPAAAVAPAASTVQEKELRFEFFGKGVEYFKIWIVNILLTIVTLGIYSAWAKVRNLQYFYGNTRLNNASFEYTAKPLQILKGRIIAMVFLVAYSVLSHTSPMLALAMLAILLIALPWVVVMSLRFNARYSSYRNISFKFHGGVWAACKAYVLWPLAGVFTLGILMPFAWKKQTEYIVNNHSYGQTPLSFDVNIGEYFKMLLIIIGGSVVFFVVYLLVIGGGAAAASLAGGNGAFLALMIPMLLLYLAFYLVIGSYVTVTMANIQYNHTRLAEHRFSANWHTLSYLKLLFVNTLLILITLGLYIPFAKVRTAAYKAEHTQLIAGGDLDNFVAAEKEQTNSLAEGVNDLFAMDISI